MDQDQGKEAPAGTLTRALAALALALLLAAPAAAQFNPLSVVGKVFTSAIDVRSTDEIGADGEIAAGASKRLLDDKQAEWAGVTVLVFARHVVLAGAVKSAAVKKRVEELVRQDKRIRSLKNELLLGDVGSLARDTALEAKINANLTATKGIASVNMRWCATGGHVVLMGVAQSRQEAALALKEIRGVTGIKDIKSHLRVVAAKK